MYVLHIAHDDRPANVSCHHRRIDVEGIVINYAHKLWVDIGLDGPLPSGQELLDFLVDCDECVHVYRCEVDSGKLGTEIELTLGPLQKATA